MRLKAQTQISLDRSLLEAGKAEAADRGATFSGLVGRLLQKELERVEYLAKLEADAEERRQHFERLMEQAGEPVAT